MILPAPRTDGRRQRVVAVTGAVVLLVGLQSGLRSLPLPSFPSSVAIIRRLNPVFVERFTAPPPPTPRGGSADDVPPPPAAATARLEQEVGSAIEALERRFGGERGASSVGSDGDPRAGAAPPEAGLALERPNPRFRELFGSGDEVAAVPTPRVRAPAGQRANAGAAGLEVAVRADGPRAAAGTASPPDGPVAAVAAARERGAAATPLVIEEHTADSFGGSEVDRLGRWMERHRAELPVGVRVHLNYRPPLLTSVVPVTANGRALELFLMLNRGLSELHILLVEGDRSVYLIDRGFQAQSRSLREGTVRRMDGEIVAVDSRAEAASSERARELYNVFLSWWEAVGRDADR